MSTANANSIRIRSILLTLAIHGLLLLALYFMMIHIPNPPFPEEGGGNGGVLVNIGFEDAASGEIQPMAEVVDPTVQVNSEAINDAEEAVATQDNEEATPVIVNKDTPKDKPKNTKTEPVKKTEPIKVEVPVRTVNIAALYKGKNNNSTSQGTAASGSGDQGKANGDPNSNGNGNGGSGNGNGNGTGNGNGNGNGNGDGNGNGKGPSFSLAGRKMLQKPTIKDNSQETGTVVVGITVDKTGRVSKATPGLRGTNTSSDLLQALAKQAALTAKFNPSPEAAEEQNGTITFVFTVQ